MLLATHFKLPQLRTILNLRSVRFLLLLLILMDMLFITIFMQRINQSIATWFPYLQTFNFGNHEYFLGGFDSIYFWVKLSWLNVTLDSIKNWLIFDNTSKAKLIMLFLLNLSFPAIFTLHNHLLVKLLVGSFYR